MRRIVVGIVVLAGAAAFMLGYLYRQELESFAPGLFRSANSDVLRLYGHIDLREARPGFNLQGRIVALHAEEGDTVAPGQLLAELDAVAFRAEVDAAAARLEAARQRLARLEAGSRPQEIERARAEVRRLEALLRDAELSVERLRKLAADRFAPRAQLDTAEARAEALRAQLAAARQTLSLLVEGPRREDIGAARAEVARAEAELRLARKRLRDTRLESPVAGVVTGRLQEKGDVVLPFAPIYTISLSDPVWARVFAPEPLLGRLHEGMKARILTDSGGVYEAWIGYISPEAEFTPKTVQTEDLRTSLVYQLRVYARNPDRGLRRGMPVTVEIPLDRAGGEDAAGGP